MTEQKLTLRSRIEQKARASGVHLTLSAIVLGSIFLWAWFVWYPAPYFEIKGTSAVFRILVGVDLVLGPALTFIVFRRGKKGLAFDLSAIVLMQLVALVYGTAKVYEERPFYMVFALDQFYVLASKDVYSSDGAYRETWQKPLTGPVVLVATLPDDHEARQRLLIETGFEGKPDLERRPEFWSAYAEDYPMALAASRPIERLLIQRPACAARIERLVEESGLDYGRLAWLPLIGRHSDFAVFIDRQGGGLVGAVPCDAFF